MKEDKIIRFKLLGSFSYGDNCRTSLKAGKKTLSFLQYLIVNHERQISSQELIEKFWAERGNAPSNALRAMLFKVRSLLNTMFPYQDELILTLPGGYMWNQEVRLELDTDRFERLYLETKKKHVEECNCEQYLEALALYQGDFLSANDSEWAIVLRQYYRTLYLDACKAVLPLLWKKERWMELVGVCEKAYQIDFSVEDFTAYQMRALIAMGHTGQVIEVYEAFRMKMQQEFELSPGEQIEQLYTLALGLGKKEMGASDIFKLVCQGNSDERAFFCTFETFQNVVTLEKRHLARSGHSSTLAIVSLGKTAALSTDTRRLERILQEGLRAGDPVARLEAGVYILLLTGADAENARLVISRLDCIFHKTYRHSKAHITYRIAALNGNDI